MKDPKNTLSGGSVPGDPDFLGVDIAKNIEEMIVGMETSSPVLREEENPTPLAKYYDDFLTPREYEYRQTILIDKGIYTQLKETLFVFDHKNKSSLISFVSNILSKHLEEYKDLYNAMVEKRIKEIKR